MAVISIGYSLTKKFFEDISCINPNIIWKNSK